MRQRREIKLKVTVRRVAWVAPALIAILAVGFTLFFNFSSNDKAYAAANGDYRSNGTGNWEAAATWQKYNGSAWVAATAAPSSLNGVITIQNGHTVTINSILLADQIVVNNGGTLVASNSAVLTFNNGTGTELDVSGIFKNAAALTINAGASIIFQSAGKYQHNFTTSAGTIPTATWAAGSTCEIIGYTNNNSTPSGMQNFSNFVWNCPSQTKPIYLNGALTSVTSDLTIISTGTGSLFLSNSTASTLSVGANFVLTGGTFSLSDGSGISSIMNIAETFKQTGGTFSVVDGSGSTGAIYASGDWTRSGGTLKVGGNGSTSAMIYFNRAGSQTFTATTATVTGNVDYNVRSGANLILGSSTVLGRNFTVSPGAKLTIGHPAGISTSGATGNIQVTGTRTFDVGADYIFNGPDSQVMGNAVPTTTRNLTVSNGTTMNLTSDITVTGTLALTNGKINTGSYTLNISNNSTSSITGYSTSNYVIGNLRRTVSGSGTYDFPVGSATASQLMSLRLSSVVGVSSILGKFTASNPLPNASDMPEISISGVDMFEVLDAGYWTLTPNSPLTGGSYNVTVTQTGYGNNLIEGILYSLLNRTNSASPWASVGNHSDGTQIWSGTSVTAARTGMTTFGDFAIADGDFPAFTAAGLLSGTAGYPGAKYLFPSVMRGVDAWVTLVDTVNGASLNNIDDQSTGYSASFQPFVNYKGNKDGYIEWLISFKKAGTSTDTTLQKLTATGVDVDGSSSGAKTIQEYVTATMPQSYSLDPATVLTVTNVSGRYRALGSSATVSNIDTTAKQAMFELTYKNVNQISYRTGAVNTMSSTETRQTSIYFRSFGLGRRNIALPIKLSYFDSKFKDGIVNLNWETESEINNDYFTIERSSDGINFESILTKKGAGNSTSSRYYTATDLNPLEGYSYYRLKQTDFDGHFSYSEVQTVKNKGGKADDELKIEITSVVPNPFIDEFKVNYILKEKGQVQITVISASGEQISDESVMADDGYNTYTFTDNKGLPKGIYFVILMHGEQKITKKILKS